MKTWGAWVREQTAPSSLSPYCMSFDFGPSFSPYPLSLREVTIPSLQIKRPGREAGQGQG